MNTPEHLGDLWLALLEEESPRLHLFRPIWFEAWDAAFRNQGNWSGAIQYLCVPKEGVANIILPLAFQKVGPFRFVSLPGFYLPFRNIPARIDCKNSIPELIELLAQIDRKSGVRIGPIQADNPISEALAIHFRNAGWSVMKNKSGTEFNLDLPATPDEFISGLNRKVRKNLKYYWNKMNRLGRAELNTVSGIHQDDWARIFEDLAHVESNAWISSRGEPRFLGKKNQKFWNYLVSDPWMRRAMHVWLIYLDDNPVSFALTIDSKDVRYVIANSYDEKVAEFSTGSKLYFEMILDAISGGLKTINFGIGDAGYKSQWKAVGNSKLIDIVAFPNTPLGRTAYVAALAQGWLKALQSRLSHKPSVTETGVSS